MVKAWASAWSLDVKGFRDEVVYTSLKTTCSRTRPAYPVLTKTFAGCW